MKLYSFRRCPYAIRARLILRLCHTPYTLVEVDLKNKPQDMLDYSPKGTVPVLVLDNGKVIDESLDIMHYVLSQATPKGWVELSSTEVELGEVLLSKLTKVFIPALNRFKYAERYEDVDLGLELEVLNQYISELEAGLTSKNGLVSESFSVYDCAVFPLIRQLIIAKSDALDAFPKTQQWFMYWQSSKEVNEIMQKSYKGYK